MSAASPRPAVFLDRDGTIIKLCDYLCSLDEIELLPNTARGLRLLRDAGYLLIVVTNQSGVARGYFDENFVAEANEKLSDMLESEGVLVDAFYYCPHHPDFGESEYRVDCECRKPKIGMIRKAVSDFDIDLRSSWVIGDNRPDLEMAANAGLRSVLVRTGYGEKVAVSGLAHADVVADDLYDAAVRIVAGSGEN